MVKILKIFAFSFHKGKKFKLIGMLFSCQIKNTDTVSHTTLNMENDHQVEPNVTESAVLKENNVEMDHNDMHDISTDVISETEPDDACDKLDNQKLHTEETVSKYNLSKNRKIPEYLQDYDLKNQVLKIT